MYLRPLLTDEMLKVQPKRLNGKSSIDACCFFSLFADLADLKTDVSHTFSIIFAWCFVSLELSSDYAILSK